MTVTSAAIRVAVLGTLCAAAVALGGASSASAAMPIAPVMPNGPAHCTSTGGAGPGYNASIGNRQNGATVCIVVGEKLLVLLSVSPTSGSSWGHVQASPSGILTSAPLTLMLSQGLTGTNFLATSPGVVELTAHRHACSASQSGSASCSSLLSWKSIVVVRSPHKIPE
jgi:hypothetical protein